ncbi:glycosyl hydrolase [Olivibacter sp. CPCC 100613]|uniref:glycosyl hydrolase n=1 Tax=Olivibacter sp. CPCC 100613 TaxID=3079931 RepID=UPI002FF90CAD
MEIRTILLLILALVLSAFRRDEPVKENSKLHWPTIKQEMKPWTRWWWFGNAVTESNLTAALESYKKAGLGGVEITPIYGVHGKEDQFIDFLTPAWMDKLDYTLKEAQRLGLGVDLANASGWPFGGPWVNDTIACKNMVSKTFSLMGGQRLNDSIKYIQKALVRVAGDKKVDVNKLKKPITANEHLQAYAFDQVRFEKELPLILLTANKVGAQGFSEVIDISNKVVNGKLKWTAPEGKWVICALFQGDHGKMVERAGPGGEGNVIDHFSAEALKKYLQPFDEAFKGHDLQYLRYFFNDSYEVDDAQGQANWTPAFFTTFKKLRGYDLTNYIPALLGLDSPEKNSRVLYDYRLTISDLLLDEYTKNWQGWAAKKGKGIRNQAHGSPANVLDLYAASDVPEIEGTEIVNLKSAPSAGHVTGKNLISSESATWLNEHFESNFGNIKTALDQLWLAGVNHVFYHGTAYSPQEAKWPGWLFYAAVHFTPTNSLWADFGAFNQYAARTQAFLQAGKPSNDILLYFGISDLWSEPGKQMLLHFHSNRFFDELSLKTCGNYLSKQGYSWDAISDQQLLNVNYQHSSLQTGGNRYKTVVIPEMHYMPIETFEKLLNLANQGANIVFYKRLPDNVPGLAKFEEAEKQMNVLKNRLFFREDGDNQTAYYGKGRVIILNDLSDLTKHTQVLAENMYTYGLQSIRRLKADNNYYYFINNPSDKAFKGWVTLNADYQSVGLYNLMTGTDGYGKTRKKGDKTEVYLQLKPKESLVVETFKDTNIGPLYPYYEVMGQGIPLSNDWQITFLKGGPTLPGNINTKELRSWTTYGENYTNFSGTASYKTTIPKLPTKADAWSLLLDEVHESASVYLNGKYLATLFNKPYCIEIPANLFKGNDELEIKVSNRMANRIADMDKKGIQWRIFYNTNFNARKKENVGEDGKFTAKNWEPTRSGLVGRVSLIPLLNNLSQ